MNQQPEVNPLLGLILRVRELFRGHPVARIIWQLGVAIVGGALVAAGVAMLVLPGPGWVVIALGLVVLASEFVWFEYPLKPVRRLLEKSGVAADPMRRKLAIGVAVGATAVGGIAYYVSSHPNLLG